MKNTLLVGGIMCLALAALLAVAFAGGAVAQESEVDMKKLEEMKQQRKEAAHRKRRIIFDNDGNEPVYYCEKADADEFLERRTKAVVGTQVDTIVYCTWSSGFSYFTHNTKVGKVFDCTSEEPGKGPGSGFSKNKTRAFIEQGTDPLEIMVDYCRKNGIEIFWSMRMNDIHDAWGAWYSPFLFPPIKKEHPEWLMGTEDNRPENGAWTAIDYGQPEIRDLAFRFFEEVCSNYDVDGVEMDFFRHLNYFRTPASGKPATQEELDMMTDLFRRIRKMADETGVKRGRPILISARVPDSVEFCRTMGFDIVRWMKEDLIDILVVSGYFRLNPWETSVKLGHKYGVPVYPCLSESRIKDGDASKVRASLECYRARAMNVLNSGADGVYMFNYFNPHSPLWSEVGARETLDPLDKVYTTAARGNGNLDFWFTGGERFQNRSFVTPDSPRKLEPGQPETAELPVGQDLQEAGSPDVTLHLRVAELADADDISVKLNGESLETGSKSEAGLEFAVSLARVKQGVNQIEVTLDPGSEPGPVLQDLLLWVRYQK